MNKNLSFLYGVFFLIIAIEFIVKRRKYNYTDTIQTLTFLTIFSLLFNFIYKSFHIYTDNSFRISHFENNFLTLVTLTILFDFIYYWVHRLEHQYSWLWFSHIHHHSSRYMNFFTGFRSSFLQPIYLIPFTLPLLFIGFRPEAIFFAVSINKAFNFWVHQEYIKHIPILDKVFNTPSNHRVHHGKNPQYINKNFGGILIIWDKLFGTYQREEEKVQFGVKEDPSVMGFKELFLMGKKK